MAFKLNVALPGRNIFTCLAADTKITENRISTDLCYEVDTGKVFEFDGVAWVLSVDTAADGSRVIPVAVTNGAIIAATWSEAGSGGAPNPELYGSNQIGADSSGAAAGLTYHIQGAVGSKVWTATGATVKNLYGGA